MGFDREPVVSIQPQHRDRHVEDVERVVVRRSAHEAVLQIYIEGSHWRPPVLTCDRRRPIYKIATAHGAKSEPIGRPDIRAPMLPVNTDAYAAKGRLRTGQSRDTV